MSDYLCDWLGIYIPRRNKAGNRESETVIAMRPPVFVDFEVNLATG